MANNWAWLGINDEGAERLDGILTGKGERKCTMKDGPAQGVECIVPNSATLIRVAWRMKIHMYERRKDGEFWYMGESVIRVFPDHSHPS